MKTLSIDIETYSSVSLIKSGVYAYTEAPDFSILLLAYAFNNDQIEVIDLAQNEEIPEKVIAALASEGVIKTAYNANFERTCIAKYLNIPMPPNQWSCTAVNASMLGLPGNLAGVCEALGFDDELAKSKTGRALIQYFSLPCKATKKNGQRTRNLPEHDMDKWALFKAYCKQDVVAEMEIRKQLSLFPVPQSEQDLWELDQKINDKGIRLDTEMVETIITHDDINQEELLEEAKAVTGLSNPNSVAQLKKWLADEGLVVSSLNKATVNDLLENATGDIKRALELRQAMSKTSTKKYQAMERAVCADNRVRGCLRFYGANRTGRWCLAEDTRILVRIASGEIMEKVIQEVSKDDEVWDGKQWVNHEGVIYSGDKEVITWDGITATHEHMVFVSEDERISLIEAKQGGIALWKGNTPYIK